MARPIRIDYENAVYHVTARGNERRQIYRDDQDRTRFLDTYGSRGGRTIRPGDPRLLPHVEDPQIAGRTTYTLGSQGMTEVAQTYGYRDGSGVHQVIRRLEARA